MAERMTAQQLIDAFKKAREPRGKFKYVALLFLVPSVGCIEHIHAFWDWRTIDALIEEAVKKENPDEPIGIMGIRPDGSTYIDQFNKEDWVLEYIKNEISHVHWQIVGDSPKGT